VTKKWGDKSQAGLSTKKKTRRVAKKLENVKYGVSKAQGRLTIDGSSRLQKGGGNRSKKRGCQHRTKSKRGGKWRPIRSIRY